MSSAHAIRLYELLMQWGSRGWREVEIEWLKKTLMVDENYERLDNFKKRVIDVAVSQINEHSDLAVRYEQRKTGRTVSHLKFVFEPKEKPPQPARAEEVPQDSPPVPAPARPRHRRQAGGGLDQTGRGPGVRGAGVFGRVNLPLAKRVLLGGNRAFLDGLKDCWLAPAARFRRFFK